MKSRRLAVFLLIFSLWVQPNQTSAAHEKKVLTKSQSGINQQPEQIELERRRSNFASGRKLLLEKGVPFEPEELLNHDWRERLGQKLNEMPDMQKSRYEAAPLQGAYVADTLYLPENVTLSGHTIVLANNLVFEGHNPTIKGHFDFHFFPAQPVAVLGTTLTAALHGKPRLEYVSYKGKAAPPPFSTIANSAEPGRHVITIDVSGTAWQPVASARKDGPRLHSVSWKGSKTAPGNTVQCPTGCNNSGGSQADGAQGTPAPPVTTVPPGVDRGGIGICNSHQDGFDGNIANNGANNTALAGTGGQGPDGFPGGNINGQVADNDLNVYSFISNGGQGGKGGRGGTGGRGGEGGPGGDGGDGASCGCTRADLGVGGDSSQGGIGGKGGLGGNGGVGGAGGNGGTITVSIPWNSPADPSTSNEGGPGGLAGDPGPGGEGGAGGPAGLAGVGASDHCGNGFKASDGQSLGMGPTGFPGDFGAPGAPGTPGMPGPTPSITRRTKPPSGGGGSVGDPCLGGSGTTGTHFGSRTGGGGSTAPDCSPIIIDTESEGFHLTSAENGVMFDIRGDAHPVNLGWTAPGSHNAFLALDRNGDGVINDGKELFGNFTDQPPSDNPNGFLALAEFDKVSNGGNADGVIDEHDAVYSKLRLWIDENHDGICQLSELYTLPELGVLSLSLEYFQAERQDQFGNQFRYKAKVNPNRHDKRDERSEVGRWAYDVFLTSR